MLHVRHFILKLKKRYATSPSLYSEIKLIRALVFYFLNPTPACCVRWEVILRKEQSVTAKNLLVSRG